jgi:hypothetical protein
MIDLDVADKFPAIDGSRKRNTIQRKAHENIL